MAPQGFCEIFEGYITGILDYAPLLFKFFMSIELA
jgi:hypothetical protein